MISPEKVEVCTEGPTITVSWPGLLTHGWKTTGVKLWNKIGHKRGEFVKVLESAIKSNLGYEVTSALAYLNSIPLYEYLSLYYNPLLSWRSQGNHLWKSKREMNESEVHLPYKRFYHKNLYFSISSYLGWFPASGITVCI